MLHFMTRKGLINTGVLAVKRPLLPERYCSVSVPSTVIQQRISHGDAFSIICVVKSYSPSHALSSFQRKVIVIGAGASGLAAARQLQNFGTQVTPFVSALLCGAGCLHSSLSRVYRWWCLRRGRESGVVCGMMPPWVSPSDEELKSSMAV